MEEAIPGVPGAYPGTPADESVPSPSPTPHQHHTSHRHHRHEHHEHNKLHKSNDPRGHRHVDSGVGLIESQPIYPSSVDDTKPRAFSEHSPAPNALTYDSQHSASSPESNYTHAARHDGSSEPVQEPSQASAGFLEAPKKAESKLDTKADSNASENKTKSSSTTPPYWGDLPKSMKGGIYNTVMGHGSQGDDHAQHHGMPQRSASDRAHVTGPTTEFYSGGVYNTITGHGSQDEESRRHGHGTTHLTTDVPVAHSGADLQVAPLPGIAEEKEKEKVSDYIATETGRSDIARGFLPETAARDDVALAEAAGVASYGSRESPRSSTAHGSRNEPFGSGNDFAAPHRAFPLSSSPDRTHRRSQDISAPVEQQQSAESDNSRGAMAMTAGAGATGAALAASERKDKPNKLRKQKEPSPSSKNRQRGNDDTIDKTDKAVATSLPPRYSHEKNTTRSERTSSEERSSTSEKKHHGILGIFHRRKDSKGEKDGKRSVKDVAEPKSDEQSRHSSHKKEETAAAAAAGAGTYGILHHNKDNDQKVKDQRSNSEPAARKSEDTKRRSRRMSANQSAAAAVAESAGAFGVLYQKPQDKENNERQGHKSIDTTKPPAPPERSPKRRSMTPPSSMAFTTEAAHPPSAAQGSQSYNIIQPNDDSAKYAGAGVAAGLGASIFANNAFQSQREESTASDLTQQQSGLSKFESPRDPPPTPANAPLTAKSQESQVYHKSTSPQASEVVTNEPGNYNTLPSGTASGMKAGVSSDKDTYSAPTYERATADDQSGLYNVLPSGTPSGVKIRPKTSGSSITESQSQRLCKHGDDQYNSLPSGTASGVDVEHQRRAPVQAEAEPQAAKHSYVAAPTLRHKQARSELTTFPPPEQAQKMSPEVLPDSYRGQSHPIPGTDRDTDARTQKAQGAIMSPEVLPDSYREQSHAVPGTDRAPAPARSQASAVDPALAAATGAWAGKTAASSGGMSDHARVMHKCEYCGRDNDISSQFTKENVAKVTKKQGSTSNWWQDA